MQPIPDTAPTNITEEPKRGLNPGRGNGRERGRCPRYWGIVLGLSEGAIYARRPPKGIDEGSNGLEGDRRGIEASQRISKDLEGDRRGSKDREGPRRSSKVLEGPRDSSKGRRRYSGYPYGFVRRWRGLSRLATDVGVRMKGRRRCGTVWG